MIILAAIAGVPVSLIAMLHQQSRPEAQRVLLLCSAVAVGGILGYVTGPSHRMRRIRTVVSATKPLTQAIHAYENANGRPPETLDALVPRYLAAVPSTGMGGYPKWEYTPSAQAHEGNSWVLIVETGGPGLNWDQMMYFPNQRYPATGYGGNIERIEDWAYVHE
jgi:hypothetical protein